MHDERLTMAMINLDPNLDIPEHQHDNEQLGFVLHGKATMVSAGDDLELGIGEVYSIPSNVGHSARTRREGATVLNIFALNRADWEKAQRLEPSPGR